MSAQLRAAIALVALFAAAAVVTPTGGSAGRTPGAVPGAPQVESLLRGIPQDGPWLGRKTAPLTLIEYVDVQCPYCARFSSEVLPTVVKRYVRTGRVRILFRGLAFVGPDSVRGLRWATAAARQDRLWNVLELLFVNQGDENGGWVTQRLLNSVARDVHGLDVSRVRRDAGSAWVSEQLRAMAAAAKHAHVPGTPYFEVGRMLGPLEPVTMRSFSVSEFTSQLDRRLR